MGPFSRLAVLLLALLSIGQAVLFCDSFQYFFQGDSLYWLAERYSSWGALAEGFRAVDSYGFFRPLSHPLIPALAYPLFGLNPFGYHAVVFALFVITTWTLFAMFRKLAGGDPEAFLATLFFGVHTVNVFVTFDLAFAPELLYGLFYVLSALFFLKSRTDPGGKWLGLSLLCFLLSLLSKEAAVTLPANLLVLAAMLPDEGQSRKKGWAKALQSTLLHWSLLLLYLAYLALGVRGGRLLLFSPAERGFSEIGQSAAENLGRALQWGLNLPAGWHTEGRQVPAALEAFLLIVAAVVLVGLLDALFRPDPRRRLILGGFAWFVIALAPALALTDFKPYYVYVPVMGLSLSAGSTLMRLRRAVPRRMSWLGDFGLVLAIAMLWQSSHLVCNGYLARHPLLGMGAENARQAAESAQLALPELPRGATLLILDTAERPLWWDCAGGRLFQLVYGDPSLKVLFLSLGQFPDEETIRGSGFAALQPESGAVLISATEAFREDPGRYGGGDDSSAEPIANLIQVEPAQVRAGEGRYTLRVLGGEGREVEIRMRVEGGPVGSFAIRLDARGQTSFFVSSGNRKGVYEFLAARVKGSEWQRSEPPARLVVR